MNIAQRCIQRPVLTLVAMFLLIIIGMISFQKLTVRHLPNINQASISVVTRFSGAGPELVEKEITIPLENILAGISGVSTIHSRSVLNKSRITMRFNLDTDINEAINDIRNKSASFFRKLPDGAEMPQVYRNDDDSNPVAIIGFQDDKRNPLEITDYVTRYIKPVLQETSGVGEVSFFGARDYAIKIALDPLKMTAHNVTVAMIKQALKQQNIDIPGGQIKSKNRHYTVVAQARLPNPKAFGQLVVGHRQQQAIHLRDVAQIKVESDNEDSLLRINGKSAIGVSIKPQSTANPVDVARNIHQTLAQLRLNFPDGFAANVFFDATEYIQRSIHEIYKTFIEATLFVAIVVFLFLGNVRSALIPIATIPICIIAAFAPMYWLGYELNTLTMLAMVLAIGLVVDDAIVVLENCHRHMLHGMGAMQAAIRGGSEISFALVAMTITLAAVYLPMGFVEGFTGKLLQQFGITLAITVLISGVVALSLSPLMCAKLLTREENRYSQWVHQYFNRLSSAYEKSLRLALQHRKWLAGILTSCLLVGILCYVNIGSELAPTEDQSYIIGPVSAPTNTSTQYVDHYVKQIEKIYADVPEQANWLTSITPGSAFTLLKLRPWEQRTRTQQAIGQDIDHKLNGITGVSVYPVNSNPLSQRGGNTQFGIALLSHHSYAKINEAAKIFALAMERGPWFSKVKNNFSMDSEQIDLQIDRQLANDLEVNLADVAELIATMVGGNNPVNFTYDGQSYNVVLQLEQDLRRDISILNQLYVKSERGKMIPLTALVRVSHSIGPDNFPHLNRLRSITLSAELNPGVSLHSAIEAVEKLAKETLPEGIQYHFTGSAEEYLESSNSTTMAFVLALVFIYLVLAAQFESFIDPFIVLLTVPLCLLGAISTLYLGGINLSIYSTLGLITLIGLITKHGILITEFANQHVQQGVNRHDAILKSARLRLRPILMTTMAMLLGALPLALASGAGAESRRQLGIVILSGMSLGTLFSLYIVPTAWLLFSRKKVATPVEEYRPTSSPA
ncbi:MAG: efflux RND transporter permease subunit [Legionellaceae bacterium]|nr:efflux RND transporter permease subunit [Legionellaceae bacterium]